MSVLDLGSDSGDVSFIAAKIVGPEGYVLGLDQNEKLLEIAQETKKSTGQEHVDFLCCSLENIPKDLGYFDAIIGRRILMYLENLQKVLSSVLPNLKTEGILIFQESDDLAKNANQ